MASQRVLVFGLVRLDLLQVPNASVQSSQVSFLYDVPTLTVVSKGMIEILMSPAFLAAFLSVSSRPSAVAPL
jgi:hypothetical protein